MNAAEYSLTTRVAQDNAYDLWLRWVSATMSEMLLDFFSLCSKTAFHASSAVPTVSSRCFLTRLLCLSQDSQNGRTQLSGSGSQRSPDIRQLAGRCYRTVVHPRSTAGVRLNQRILVCKFLWVEHLERPTLPSSIVLGHVSLTGHVTNF